MYIIDDSVFDDMSDEEIFALLQQAELVSQTLSSHRQETDNILNAALQRGCTVVPPHETVQ